MFIVGWIRALLSLPILWLGQLALYFKQPVSIALLSAAWAVGGDAEVGRSALEAVFKFKGRDAALAKAREWLERYPRPHFAAFAGLISLNTRDLEEARQFLARGRRLGDDPMGRLDWLEYLIAARSGRGTEAARQFESRHDLPADLSRMILNDLMFDDLLSGRFDEARRRAERLLEVDQHPPAEIVLWALATRAGDAAGGESRFPRTAMPPAQKSYFGFLACAATGLHAQAQEYLAALREQDPNLALHAEDLLKSRESPHEAGRDAAVPAGPAGGDHGA